MTVTTNELGQNNLFAKEPKMFVDPSYTERYGLETHAERAEKANGRYAMLGIVAGAISYALTGKLFFGVVWFTLTNRKMFNEKAERINGLAAMIGFVAGVGAYALTGQIIPGIWWQTQFTA